MKHIIACCTICPWCHTKVTVLKIHQAECHKEEMLEKILNEAAGLGLLFDPEAWIDMPNGLLDKKTPRELVEEGRGDKVLGLIEAINDGVMF